MRHNHHTATVDWSISQHCGGSTAGEHSKHTTIRLYWMERFTPTESQKSEPQEQGQREGTKLPAQEVWATANSQARTPIKMTMTPTWVTWSRLLAHGGSNSKYPWVTQNSLQIQNGQPRGPSFLDKLFKCHPFRLTSNVVSSLAVTQFCHF